MKIIHIWFLLRQKDAGQPDVMIQQKNRSVLSIPFRIPDKCKIFSEETVPLPLQNCSEPGICMQLIFEHTTQLGPSFPTFDLP